MQLIFDITGFYWVEKVANFFIHNYQRLKKNIISKEMGHLWHMISTILKDSYLGIKGSCSCGDDQPILRKIIYFRIFHTLKWCKFTYTIMFYNLYASKPI